MHLQMPDDLPRVRSVLLHIVNPTPRLTEVVEEVARAAIDLRTRFSHEGPISARQLTMIKISGRTNISMTMQQQKPWYTYQAL